MAESVCTRCGERVEIGFAAVALDGTVTPLFWVGGELVTERLTRGAEVTGRPRLPVTALRCSACGLVTFETV